ncbi:hypothetical protein NAC44_16815 [Allorhizobium sp. BGMRC 0089]|uniref:hypothetical protein n=1 Tax=Allorhizobium sonneratiae TaxID=2934936 RepID=UPI00203337CB|nr:hypothetical protein [Allorhizobium sonneratiae]MCM2293989.1 hypothetical protein [Allorhizobium sonneratiae]
MNIIENAGAVPPGGVIVRLYHSGDQVRGYVRLKGEEGTDDSILPGEELEPEDAFIIARNHNRDLSTPIYVELKEGVTFDPAWERGGERDGSRP